MVWDVRIIDENDDLLCISRCTVAIKEKREKKRGALMSLFSYN